MARKKTQGRAKGSKNLIRKDNNIINQFGVKFSQEEVRQMQNMVRRVNRKREKMLKAEAGKPIYWGNRPTGEDRDQLRLMGEEMDLVIRKRSAGLQRFKTKKEFNYFMRMTEKAAATDYLDYRGKLYKRNLITAIKEHYPGYPDEIKGVIMRIQMMPQKEFQEKVQNNRLFQIKPHYDVRGQLARIQAMRDVLGLRNNDFEDDMEY